MDTVIQTVVKIAEERAKQKGCEDVKMQTVFELLAIADQVKAIIEEKKNDE